MSGREGAEAAIKKAEEFIVNATRQGKYTASALSKLAEARAALVNGNYVDAKKLADQAKLEVKDKPQPSPAGSDGGQTQADATQAAAGNGLDPIGIIIGGFVGLVLIMALALTIGWMMKEKKDGGLRD